MDPAPCLGGLHLPLSSLRLFVSPICLMSASMWQVAQQRNVKQYGKLEEFVTLVTESVPELLTFIQRTQLILGLRARLVLELCQSEDSLDPQTIQHHLDRIHLCTEGNKKENKEEDVEEFYNSKSNFVELVQTLLKDSTEREHFFKEVFPIHYGPRYDTALQLLVWEFFSRLEELLPVPSFSQAATYLGFIVSDLEDCEESFSDPEPLTTLLQHQRSKGLLDKSQFSFNADTIWATLSLVQDEPIVKKGMGGRTEAESERENVNKGIEDWEQVDNGDDVHEGMDEDPEAGESHFKQHDPSPQVSSLSPSVANNGQSGDAASNVLIHPSSHVTNKIVQQHHIKKQHPVKVNQIEASGCLPSTSNQTLCGEPKGSSAKTTKMLTCTQCQRSFRWPYELKRHHIVHTEVKRFPCNQCQKSFKCSSDVKRHHFKVHFQVELPCLLCDETFNSKDGLRMHKRIHAGEKPYVCSHCGRGFMYSQVLKSHERIHTGERPFACSLCDKKYKQRPLLTYHMRTHTGDKPYLCSACGKTFCSSGALLIHSRGHTGERPYHCDYCGKKYTTLQKLKDHQRNHTGERPYSCKFCEKCFPTATALNRHTRIHTGDKPHQCPKCGKTFTQRGNMKIHLRSHKS